MVLVNRDNHNSPILMSNESVVQERFDMIVKCNIRQNRLVTLMSAFLCTG